MNVCFHTLADRGGRCLLGLILLGLATTTLRAATFVSFQEGDVRVGDNRDTVNTNGTVVNAAYNMAATHIRSDNPTATRDGLQLIAGTQASGNRLHTLLAFNVSHLTNLVAGDLARIDSVALVLTHDNAGSGGNATLSVHQTRPFAEATATWSNPHGDSLDAGGFLGTDLRQRTTVGTSATPAREVWGSPAAAWADGGSGPDSLLEAVRGALTNGSRTVYLLIKRTSESNADYFSRFKHDGDATVNQRPELVVGIDSFSSNTAYLSVATADAAAAEPGTDTGSFTLTRTGDTNTAVTVHYSFSGTATPGVDFVTNGLGTVTFAPGITTATVTIAPLDDADYEGAETVVLNLLPDAAYTIVTASASLALNDDLDMPPGALAAYLFNENNNSAGLLGNAAAAVTPDGLRVAASNAVAGPGLAPFGAGGGTANNHGYGTSYYVSPPSALYVRASVTAASEIEAVLAERYISVTLAPQPGYSLAFTGLAAQVKLQSTNLNTATWFVRSSLDGFTENLGSFTVTGNGTALSFSAWTNALAGAPWQNVITPVELRFYCHATTQNNGDFLRLEDLMFFGSASLANPGLALVSVTASQPVATESAGTLGAFTLTRTGEPTNTLTVYYAASGTASNGVDYELLGGSATFPMGASNVTVQVRPLDDLLNEGTESVVLALLTNENYVVTVPASATVSVGDDEARSVFLEAENFADLGGWVVDQQFADLMGSPYVLAHGLGKPAADARTTAVFPTLGTYRLWVRNKDWTAPLPDHPGVFKVLLNGVEAPATFGATGQGWLWQDGGLVDITNLATEIRLRDLTGFDGRCDALLFTQENDFVPPDSLAELAAWRREQLRLPATPVAGGDFDLVVVGGGIAGTAAAVAAARQGLQVALIHDRPFLGGNASQDVRVHTLGETRGGIVTEINTPDYQIGIEEFKLTDQQRHQVVRNETNIHLFTEWRAFGVVTNLDGGSLRLTAVDARHNRTGEERRFTAPLFIDSTGDGWIGYWAGAQHRMGREAQGDHGESLAPAAPDGMTMGTTLSWYSRSAAAPSAFPGVPWATNVSLDYSALRGDWYWEYGLNRDTIYDAEQIRDHLLRAIYGTFWNIKQSAANTNRELGWVAHIGGKRESRRLIGDYLLTEHDVRNHPAFPDAVVMERREIDIHFTKAGPYDFITYAQFTAIAPYWIPFRCLYSTNVANLMMAGRCLSATHVGLGSPRVMNTCGQMGVATGMAAALCKKYSVNPRGVYQQHIPELQALLDITQTASLTNVVTIIDNADTNRVQVTGAWQSSTSNPGYYGTDYLHDLNSGKGTKRVRFTPDLPLAGDYRVYARWTASSNRATNTLFHIVHRGGTNTVAVNQQAEDGNWVPLGAFAFDQGNAGGVIVDNAGTSAYVIADAVAFVSAFDLAPEFSGNPWQDDDTDGVPNYVEYLKGTDPQDAASVVRQEWQADGSGLKLRFHAAAGRSYLLQRTDSLNPPAWTTLLPVAPSPATRTVEFTDAIGTTNRFYRLIAQ